MKTAPHKINNLACRFKSPRNQLCPSKRSFAISGRYGRFRQVLLKNPVANTSRRTQRWFA